MHDLFYIPLCQLSRFGLELPQLALCLLNGQPQVFIHRAELKVHVKIAVFRLEILEGPEGVHGGEYVLIDLVDDLFIELREVAHVVEAVAEYLNGGILVHEFENASLLYKAVHAVLESLHVIADRDQLAVILRYLLVGCAALDEGEHVLVPLITGVRLAVERLHPFVLSAP